MDPGVGPEWAAATPPPRSSSGRGRLWCQPISRASRASGGGRTALRVHHPPLRLAALFLRLAALFLRLAALFLRLAALFLRLERRPLGVRLGRRHPIVRAGRRQTHPTVSLELRPPGPDLGGADPLGQAFLAVDRLVFPDAGGAVQALEFGLGPGERK